MNGSVAPIALNDLAFVFIPVLFVITIYYRWNLGAPKVLYANIRMLVQLLLIGYLLAFIFQSQHLFIILGVVLVMLLASVWIALNTVTQHRNQLFVAAFAGIAMGGGMSLILMTQVVLHPQPWYEAKVLIPLAGMVFANAMNSVSLSAERFFWEYSRGSSYMEARNIAFKASMIPTVNALFAVGLVSLPGMMTGQILSGVDPLIAARYQIMIMAMIFAASGIASAYFLSALKRRFS